MNGPAAHLLPIERGFVDEGAALFSVAQVTLIFENSQRGKYGAVGERRIGLESFSDLADRGGSLLPKYVHQS